MPLQTPTRPSHRPQQHGFTLIELMIVVAIVGILAAVAIPSYSDYVRRGQLQEAFTYLSDDRVKMEQYYQDNRNYGDTTCAKNSTVDFITNGNTAMKNFAIACTVTKSGQGYSLVATGKTGTLSVGHVYSVDQDNLKATTQFKSVTQSGKACWLIKSTTEC